MSPILHRQIRCVLTLISPIEGETLDKEIHREEYTQQGNTSSQTRSIIPESF